MVLEDVGDHFYTKFSILPDAGGRSFLIEDRLKLLPSNLYILQNNKNPTLYTIKLAACKNIWKSLKLIHGITTQPSRGVNYNHCLHAGSAPLYLARLQRNRDISTPTHF